MSRLTVSQRVQFINQTGIDVALGRIYLSNLEKWIKQQKFDESEEYEVYYLIIREAEKFIRQHSISKAFFISSLLAVFFGSLVSSIYFIIPQQWFIESPEILAVVYGFIVVGILLTLYGLFRVGFYFIIKRKFNKLYPGLITLDRLPLRDSQLRTNDEINFGNWFNIIPFWRQLF